MSAQEASRRLGLLIETIESECDPEADYCHDHDLTDNGQCALATDLRSIRSELTEMAS